MMSKPLVSVIMGIYNCENSIEAAIESILQQTYDNWELIMCDDGSTDSTYSIATRYMKQYPNKIVVMKNEKNLRLAATLNRCLGAAKGEYIARMDADDVSLQQRFETQVTFLENHHECDIVGCSAKIFDGKNINGVRVCKANPNKNDVLFGPPFIHPTIMIRKEVLDKLGGYTIASRTMRGQDWDLWFRFYAAGFSGHNISEALYIYHESEDDYKKRTLQAAISCSKTAFHGFQILKVAPWKYIYAIKPIVSWFVPEKIKKCRRT